MRPRLKTDQEIRSDFTGAVCKTTAVIHSQVADLVDFKVAEIMSCAIRDEGRRCWVLHDTIIALKNLNKYLKTIF